MTAPKISPADHSDYQYYHRALNHGWIWNLQHKPRRQIVDTFMEAMEPRESDQVLDLGTTNLPEPLENIFECYYPYKERITAAGIEDCSFLEQQYPGLRFVRVTPGGKLPFEDNQFDIGFSNATIEHVGSNANQAFFLQELLRVSRKVFISTPNRWFPVELHTRLPFVHWLPPGVFRRIIDRLGFSFYAKEENLNLLTAKDLVNMLSSKTYRTAVKKNRFFGLPSNIILIVHKNAEAA